MKIYVGGPAFFSFKGYNWDIENGVTAKHLYFPVPKMGKKEGIREILGYAHFRFNLHNRFCYSPLIVISFGCPYITHKSA